MAVLPPPVPVALQMTHPCTLPDQKRCLPWQFMAPKVAAYGEWAGMKINMAKSPVTAMDMRTGQRIATDSITLHGVSFPVVPPNRSHKHVGLQMVLDGDCSDEKIMCARKCGKG